MESSNWGRPAPSGPVTPASPETPPAALRVCRYALDPSRVLSPTTYPTIVYGRLAGTGKLKGARLTRFLAAVAKAPGASPCGKPQAPFAELYRDDIPDRPPLIVELGGCHSIDVDGDRRQLDAATVALLG
jgi:hypothetical protein